VTPANLDQCIRRQQSRWCRYWFFCCIHCCRESQCFSNDRTTPKIARSPWESGPPFNTWSFGPPESAVQTAFRSVQPFLRGTSVWPTLRQTDVAIGRIVCTACMRCGLIMLTMHNLTCMIKRSLSRSLHALPSDFTRNSARVCQHERHCVDFAPRYGYERHYCPQRHWCTLTYSSASCVWIAPS